MSKESKKDKNTCPIHNPVTLCPLLERLSKVEEAVSWLKKGYWIQVGISGASFITVVGFIIVLVTKLGMI